MEQTSLEKTDIVTTRTHRACIREAQMESGPDLLWAGEAGSESLLVEYSRDFQEPCECVAVAPSGTEPHSDCGFYLYLSIIMTSLFRVPGMPQPQSCQGCPSPCVSLLHSAVSVHQCPAEPADLGRYFVSGDIGALKWAVPGRSL